jgi:site-specific DNA-methyltransferase (adenine-specific)
VFEFQTSRSRVVLHNADCLEGMRSLLAPGSVSVVATSPPYNVGIRYKQYDDTRPREEYLAWIGQWADAVRSVLADDGSLFLNVGAIPSDPWVPFEVLAAMRSRFVLQNVIHWIKSIAILKEDVGDYPGITQDVVVGHYKPIQSKRYVNDCHEYLFHLTKTGDVELDRTAIGVPYQDKTNVARWASAGGGRHCRGNTWFIPYKTILSREKDRPHPATFPAKIPEMCVRLHGLSRTRLVLDPFLGIGHAALACVELGVDFTGFEIDPDYFREACQAVEKTRDLWDAQKETQ